MSRGLGVIQRTILMVMDEAVQSEPAGPYQAGLYFEDTHNRTYHPAQVVRWRWLCWAVAERWGGLYTPPPSWVGRSRHTHSLLLRSSFTASFSRAMSALLVRHILIDVYVYTRLVVRAAADSLLPHPIVGERSEGDRFVARHP